MFECFNIVGQNLGKIVFINFKCGGGRYIQRLYKLSGNIFFKSKMLRLVL